MRWVSGSAFGILLGNVSALNCVVRIQDFYFEEIRVFQAGIRLEYISME